MRPILDNVIHIEGMDLAGKSTATAALGKKFDASVRHNSLVPANEIYDLADRLRRAGDVGLATLGHLYVASLARDLELLRPVSEAVVQDSTILLRSAAFYRVLGDLRLVRDLTSMVETHPLFGVGIVLTASIEARVERLKMRARLSHEEVAADGLAVLRSPHKFLAMESALIDYATTRFDAHVIDTSNLSPTEVVDRIMHHVPEPDLSPAAQQASRSARRREPRVHPVALTATVHPNKLTERGETHA